MTRLALTAACLLAAARVAAATDVEFFYEPGCKVCTRVRHEIMPPIETAYAGLVNVHLRDTSQPTNYLRLAAYQDALAIDPDATAVVVLDGRQAFAGWAAIRDHLPPAVGEAVSAALAVPPAAPAPPAPAPYTLDDMHARMRRFTLAGVAAAGLVDGINPCAIATLVFFVSVLGVMQVRGAKLLAVGGMFCLASFLTYIAIGFGLFHALYLLKGFSRVQDTIAWTMAGILVVLAAVSLRDARAYRRTGQAGDVALKLPRRVTRAIHHVIRKGVATHHLATGGFVAGMLVTVLESVCTGQVYLPTLVMVLRSGDSTGRALAYLLLYNTLFIVPLVVALVLAYRGTQTGRFVAWSRRHVVPGKVALAMFFIAMAVLIVML